MSEKLTRKYRFKTEGNAMAFWGHSIGVAMGHKSGGVTFYSGQQIGKTVTVEFLAGALVSMTVAAAQYGGKEVKPRAPR